MEKIAKPIVWTVTLAAAVLVGVACGDVDSTGTHHAGGDDGMAGHMGVDTAADTGWAGHMMSDDEMAEHMRGVHGSFDRLDDPDSWMHRGAMMPGRDHMAGFAGHMGASAEDMRAAMAELQRMAEAGEISGDHLDAMRRHMSAMSEQMREMADLMEKMHDGAPTPASE